jgi:hypothetical protein
LRQVVIGRSATPFEFVDEMLHLGTSHRPLRPGDLAGRIEGFWRAWTREAV